MSELEGNFKPKLPGREDYNQIRIPETDRKDLNSDDSAPIIVEEVDYDAAGNANPDVPSVLQGNENKQSFADSIVNNFYGSKLKLPDHSGNANKVRQSIKDSMAVKGGSIAEEPKPHSGRARRNAPDRADQLSDRSEGSSRRASANRHPESEFALSGPGMRLTQRNLLRDDGGKQQPTTGVFGDFGGN
jgi:hypothetical protein